MESLSSEDGILIGVGNLLHSAEDRDENIDGVDADEHDDAGDVASGTA